MTRRFRHERDSVARVPVVSVLLVERTPLRVGIVRLLLVLQTRHHRVEALSSFPPQLAFVDREPDEVAESYSSVRTTQAIGERLADCPPMANGSGRVES